MKEHILQHELTITKGLMILAASKLAFKMRVKELCWKEKALKKLRYFVFKEA